VFLSLSVAAAMRVCECERLSISLATTLRRSERLTLLRTHSLSNSYTNSRSRPVSSSSRARARARHHTNGPDRWPKTKDDKKYERLTPSTRTSREKDSLRVLTSSRVTTCSSTRTSGGNLLCVSCCSCRCVKWSFVVWLLPLSHTHTANQEIAR